MRRYVFKLFHHGTSMARVLISKATLADFGVPRQDIAVRQPMPTAEEMEGIIRQGDIALTPMQYATKVPLLERDTLGYDEKFAESQIPQKFKQGMGTEGAVAQGLIAREFPQVGELDPRLTPFLRDYYGRQTTLPEHLWDYHTEGPYYDEQGNILPGQVPPVDAVKLMGEEDIPQLGNVTGFGLKPIPRSKVNFDWEMGVPPNQQFPVENAGFVGPFSDLDRNVAGNVSGGRGKGLVGIRGFGRPQDKALARGNIVEGKEGVFTAPIPPERLVGIMPSTRVDREDAWGREDMKHLMAEVRPQNDRRDYSAINSMIAQMAESGEISVMDAIHAIVRNKALQKEGLTFGDMLQQNLHLFPYTTQLRNTPADVAESYAGKFDNTPAAKALKQAQKAQQEAIPFRWEQGVFGLENPLLTDAEKEDYLDQMEVQNWRDDIPIREKERKDLPTLYPKEAGVRFG
jgi:hypothetical protein